MVANRDKVPVYAESLAAFHKAFDAELKGIVDSLPVGRTMRVLDAACGDGFYTELLAGRLVRPGGVVGLDFNSAFLDCARARLRNIDVRCDVDFLCGSLNEIPKGTFDLIWCAQSLFSLSEPVQVLRQLGSGLRTGGVVAVLANDTCQ